MNLKQSIKNLSIKLQQKNIVVVSGNVYETFLDGREISNLRDKIKTISINLNKHKIVEYFSPADGSINLTDPDAEAETTSIDAYLKKISSNIKKDELEGQTYIIDMGDVYFSTDNQSDSFMNAFLSPLSSVLNERRSTAKELSNNEHQSKIIIIARNSGNLMHSLVDHNLEYAEVIIANPDINERIELFKNHSARFDISDKKEIQTNPEALNDVAALTDGMSLSEILQLGRISTGGLFGDEDLTFKELYFAATLNEKESSWEKFDQKEILKINDYLSKSVYGQEYAVQKTANTIKRSFVGLAGSYQGVKARKPKGILFYCGPTGVGKTEVAKKVTEFIFRDTSRMIRFDMSEFSQEHSDQRLLGSPPGYVGYDGGGELTNAVKANPHSILLFDEIEKAHPRILDKFLQILEDGRLTSSKGELINFSETFIIFTSNIGVSQTSPSGDDKVNRSNFLKAVMDHFGNGIDGKAGLNRPEILNRIGKENIVPFNYITDKDILMKIIESKLEIQNTVLVKKHSFKLEYTESDLNDVYDVVKDKYNTKDGGRGVTEVMTNVLTDPLVDFIIENNDVLKGAKEKGLIFKASFSFTKNKCSIEFKPN